MEHDIIPSGEIHTPFQWQPANAAARLAIVPLASDLNKLALQLDDHSQWLLTDDSPVTWQAYGEHGPEGPEGPTGPAGPAGASAVVNVRSFTSSGTYTPTSGTVAVIIECFGGGGQGGGCHGSPAGQVCIGSGGGAGAYTKGRFTSGFSGATVTIGAGGSTGGLAEAGQNGATTSVGSLITAPGGTGGVVGVAGAICFVPVVGGGSVGTGGNIVAALGTNAPPTLATFANVVALAGLGGASYFGGSGFGAAVTSGVAQNGAVAGDNSYGGGGGGGASNAVGSAAAGGTGANGLVIIYEYGTVSPGGFSDSSGDEIVDSAGDPIEDSSGDPASTTALALVHADETTGTTTVDDLAGRDWVASGAAATHSDSAKWGAAGLKFTGTGYFQTSESFSVGALGEPFTIKFWIKTTQTTTASLVDNYHGPSGSWQTYIQAGTTLGFYSEGGAGPSTSAAIFDGNWHFVAFVAYPTAGIAIYVDENRVYHGPSETAKANHVGTHMRIGAQANTGANPFTGSIDEVCITNTADFTGATITVPTGPFS